jgi:hypothetical protein
MRIFLLTKEGEADTKCTIRDYDVDIGIALSIWNDAGYTVEEITETVPERR